MGWTTMHRDKGSSNKDFFGCEVFGEHIEILDCSTVGGVFYAACRSDRTPDEVWAAVCRTSWAPNDQYNFGYRADDETVGPNEIDCPERILNLLTPTDCEFANVWRESCRRRIAVRKSKPKVKKGDVVHFTPALKFTNGDERNTLRFVARNTFEPEHSRYPQYQLSGWRDYDYQVVAAAAQRAA